MNAREIEGLRELISQVILEERDKPVPVSLLQDVEHEMAHSLLCTTRMVRRIRFPRKPD